MVLLVAGDGEICNNGCLNGTDGWCEKRKWKSDGTVEQCVDRTRYGFNCVSGCEWGGEYFWCHQSWHNSENWEYCGPSGKTRYDVPCVSECAQKGKDYWWCYTAQDNSEWEYCSPPSQVKTKKVTYTIYGQECRGDCDTHGKSYWWCDKTPRWPPKSGKGGSNGDSSWDYCSPQAAVQNSGSQNSSEVKSFTRYNEPCTDACAGRGKDYFWCNTIDSWDYCSPKVVATEPVIARHGRPCVGICDNMGKSYKWCTVFNAGHSDSWWDYCGPDSEEGEPAWKSWIPTIIIIATIIAIVIVGCAVK